METALSFCRGMPTFPWTSNDVNGESESKQVFKVFPLCYFLLPPITNDGAGRADGGGAGRDGSTMEYLDDVQPGFWSCLYYHGTSVCTYSHILLRCRPEHEMRRLGVAWWVSFDKEKDSKRARVTFKTSS